MLLSTAHTWPTGRGWVLEPKWDGFRVLAAVDQGKTRAWTRHGTDITAAVPGVLGELAELVPAGTVVDGELVALAAGADGRVGQDFGRLAPAVFARCAYPLAFVVFDAPRWAGEDLTSRPWHERRAALEAALTRRSRHVSPWTSSPPRPRCMTAWSRSGSRGRYSSAATAATCPGNAPAGWRKLKTRARTRARLEVVRVDRAHGRVQHIGCRAEHDDSRLTWAVVWGGELAAELIADPAAAVGRAAELTYTHRTVAGALREARLTALV